MPPSRRTRQRLKSMLKTQLWRKQRLELQTHDINSIQWLKRRRPALFRQDLITLFELLQQQKIKPLIARRFPLAESRHAHELLGKGRVTGNIVLAQRLIACVRTA
jgi:NADPH:quinone reductase-like Zn-dependent oxidoreductase